MGSAPLAECSGLNYKVTLTSEHLMLESLLPSVSRRAFELSEVRSVELVRKNAIAPGVVAVGSALSLLSLWVFTDHLRLLYVSSKLLIQIAAVMALAVSASIAFMRMAWADLRVGLAKPPGRITVRFVSIGEGLRLVHRFRSSPRDGRRGMAA